MLGMVYTELIEMIETKYSMDMADAVIEAAKLPSGGSYTAVGDYPFEEISALVGALSDATGTPAPVLVRAFGQHLFGRLVTGHPEAVFGLECAFDVLESVEGRIHREVRKLYPDADPPVFHLDRPTPHQLTLHYRSHRPLAMLALGLIEGCADHFGENLAIEHVDTSAGAGTSATFHVTRLPQ
jgi:hypothetical protein